MSLQDSRYTRPVNPFAPKEVVYPATLHFRVIVEPGAFEAAELAATLAAYKVTAPLAASRASSAGRYQAYGVSVLFQSQSELHAFDAAVKHVPGVCMVL